MVAIYGAEGGVDWSAFRDSHECRTSYRELLETPQNRDYSSFQVIGDLQACHQEADFLRNFTFLWAQRISMGLSLQAHSFRDLSEANLGSLSASFLTLFGFVIQHNFQNLADRSQAHLQFQRVYQTLEFAECYLRIHEDADGQSAIQNNSRRVRLSRTICNLIVRLTEGQWQKIQSALGPCQPSPLRFPNATGEMITARIDERVLCLQSGVWLDVFGESPELEDIFLEAQQSHLAYWNQIKRDARATARRSERTVNQMIHRFSQLDFTNPASCLEFMIRFSGGLAPGRHLAELLGLRGELYQNCVSDFLGFLRQVHQGDGDFDLSSLADDKMQTLQILSRGVLGLHTSRIIPGVLSAATPIAFLFMANPALALLGTIGWSAAQHIFESRRLERDLSITQAFSSLEERVVLDNRQAVHRMNLVSEILLSPGFALAGSASAASRSLTSTGRALPGIYRHTAFDGSLAATEFGMTQAAGLWDDYNPNARSEYLLGLVSSLGLGALLPVGMRRLNRALGRSASTEPHLPERELADPTAANDGNYPQPSTNPNSQPLPVAVGEATNRETPTVHEVNNGVNANSNGLSASANSGGDGGGERTGNVIHLSRTDGATEERLRKQNKRLRDNPTHSTRPMLDRYTGFDPISVANPMPAQIKGAIHRAFTEPLGGMIGGVKPKRIVIGSSRIAQLNPNSHGDSSYREIIIDGLEAQHVMIEYSRESNRYTVWAMGRGPVHLINGSHRTPLLPGQTSSGENIFTRGIEVEPGQQLELTRNDGNPIRFRLPEIQAPSPSGDDNGGGGWRDFLKGIGTGLDLGGMF